MLDLVVVSHAPQKSEGATLYDKTRNSNLKDPITIWSILATAPKSVKVHCGAMLKTEDSNLKVRYYSGLLCVLSIKIIE